MPIYEYRCAECGHQGEFLQKISEPPLSTCPACGKPTFRKLVSAAGFQLKGSGWYATDYARAGGGNGGKQESTGAGADSKTEGKSESKPAASNASEKPAS
jgi:putative FmdB family regulatory protein